MARSLPPPPLMTLPLKTNFFCGFLISLNFYNIFYIYIYFFCFLIHLGKRKKKRQPQQPTGAEARALRTRRQAWTTTGLLRMSSGYNSETLSNPAATRQYPMSPRPSFGRHWNSIKSSRSAAICYVTTPRFLKILNSIESCSHSAAISYVATSRIERLWNSIEFCSNILWRCAMK